MFVSGSTETTWFPLFFLTEEVHSCLWQDCGFCSVECDGEMLRHMLFHCYHSKLKQWGSAMLKAHPDMGDCSVGLQNRNIVPEVQETFLCLWEHCEVKGKSMCGMSENFDTFHWTCKTCLLHDGVIGANNKCCKNMKNYLHFSNKSMVWWA